MAFLKLFAVSFLLISTQAFAHFRVIGHRGVAGHAPENTLVSFDKAREMGLFDVELDVQISKDGQLVLFHDSTLDEKTSITGSIRDYNWDQLKLIEIGSWFDREKNQGQQKFRGTTLILLEDLFKKHGKNFYYHIEIKASDEAIPGKILAMVEKYDLRKNSQITSFYKDQLIRLRKLDPQYPLCYLIDDQKTELDLTKAIQESKKNKFQLVGVRAPIIKASHVELAHWLNLEIRAWGIKEKADMLKALDAKAEGMTIDHPEWLIYEHLKLIH